MFFDKTFFSSARKLPGVRRTCFTAFNALTRALASFLQRARGPYVPVSSKRGVGEVVHGALFHRWKSARRSAAVRTAVLPGSSGAAPRGIRATRCQPARRIQGDTSPREKDGHVRGSTRRFCTFPLNQARTSPRTRRAPRFTIDKRRGAARSVSIRPP